MEFKLNNKLKVSVLVANYNNQKYISQCIKSIINQKYKNIEIIFHDDCSQDNSIKEIKNFKKIKIIKNKKKTITGSFNQLAAYKRMFKISKGEIIFLLDSDDYFHRDKVYNVIKKYISNPKLKAIFDLPILKYNNKQNIVKNKKKIIKNFWPYIPPQSCISVRRNELNKIFKHIHFNKFPDPIAKKKETEQLHPVKRLGEPDEVANAALFLASNEASFITGESMMVDGGISLLIHDEV